MKYPRQELIRYAANGVVATVVHYAVLTFNIRFLELPSAGLANLLAATVGIATSFSGNRYFVFGNTAEPIAPQAMKFGGMYGAIALLHGAVLMVWTDWYGFDYRVGFVIATMLQVSLSYLGNKYLVFRS